MRDPLPAVPVPARADHPVRDGIVVLLFAVLLASGAMGAYVHRDVMRTAFENRPTAAWPDIATLVTDGRAWTGRFEAAFADRFGGRNGGIKIHHWIASAVFHTSPVPNVVIGRDGWLYFKGEDGLGLDRDVLGTVPYPPAEPAALAAAVKRRHDFFAAQGIPYLFTVAPDKAAIYPEHLPRWAVPLPGPTRLDRALAALKAYPDVRVVDVRPALLAAKSQRRLFFKTDSHWNYAGATVAYDVLMDAVRAELPRAPHVPAEQPPYDPGKDFYSGDLATMVGLPDRFREDDIAPLAKILGDPSRRCARRVMQSERLEIYACERDTLPTALVYRDSMAIPLIPPLSENFRRAIYVSGRAIDRELVARERPDIVIEEIAQRTMNALLAAPAP